MTLLFLRSWRLPQKISFLSCRLLWEFAHLERSSKRQTLAALFPESGVIIRKTLTHRKCPINIYWNKWNEIREKFLLKLQWKKKTPRILFQQPSSASMHEFREFIQFGKSKVFWVSRVIVTGWILECLSLRQAQPGHLSCTQLCPWALSGGRWALNVEPVLLMTDPTLPPQLSKWISVLSWLLAKAGLDVYFWNVYGQWDSCLSCAKHVILLRCPYWNINSNEK